VVHEIYFGDSAGLQPQEVCAPGREVRAAADAPQGSLRGDSVKNFRDETIDRRLEEWGVTSIYSDDTSQGGKIYEGILAAEGEVISILDDDDEFLPTKLSALYRAFSQGACYFHNGKVIIDEMGKEIGRDSYASFAIRDYNDFRKHLRAFQKKAFFHNSSSAAIRKSAINTGILKEIKLSADLFLFFSAIEQDHFAQGRYPIIFDGATLTRYRVHPSGSFEENIARLVKGDPEVCRRRVVDAGACQRPLKAVDHVHAN